jgi:hypothetical protein
MAHRDPSAPRRAPAHAVRIDRSVGDRIEVWVTASPEKARSQMPRHRARTRGIRNGSRPSWRGAAEEVAAERAKARLGRSRCSRRGIERRGPNWRGCGSNGIRVRISGLAGHHRSEISVVQERRAQEPRSLLNRPAGFLFANGTPPGGRNCFRSSLDRWGWGRRGAVEGPPPSQFHCGVTGKGLRLY